MFNYYINNCFRYIHGIKVTYQFEETWMMKFGCIKSDLIIHYILAGTANQVLNTVALDAITVGSIVILSKIIIVVV